MPTFGVWVQAKSPPSNLVGVSDFKSLFYFDSVSPMDYGAVGDGATDDAAAIQLAVNTAPGSSRIPPQAASLPLIPAAYTSTGTIMWCLVDSRLA